MRQKNSPRADRKTSEILPCVCLIFIFNFRIKCYNYSADNYDETKVNSHVNGERLKLPFNSNIPDLISYLGFQNQRIALEVNESIIPKSKHSTFLLSDNDKVEVINAVGGG